MRAAGHWLRRLLGRSEAVDGPQDVVPRRDGGGPLSFADGNNGFALALYERLRQQPGNLFVSPFSIRAALGMTLAGARGETAAQMARALCIPNGDGSLHADVAAIVQRLAAGGPGSTVSVSNSLWAQEGAVLQPAFLDVIARYYSGALHPVDFSEAPEAAGAAINRWVEEETQGKISGLIPPRAADAFTRLLLVNAVHFKGAWASEFMPSATRDAPFHLDTGDKVQAQLMHQRADAGYLHARRFEVLDLPYRVGGLSLLVLLPHRKAGLRSLEETLSAAVLADVVAQMRQQEVDVCLPRFTGTWGAVDLREPLSALGMPHAFDITLADFSGMNGRQPPDENALHLSAVVHKSFVEVNERGTEAAAATGAVMHIGSAVYPPPVPVFRADRPFIYAIRDRRSGAVLFLGRMADPTVSS